MLFFFWSEWISEMDTNLPLCILGWTPWVIRRFWRNLCPQSHVNPTTSPFFLTSRSRMPGFLHPVDCLCNFQAKASSSKVNGTESFALNRNQARYAPSKNQKLHTSRSKMSSISYTFSICLFVVHGYNMSFVRHIHSRYIISYDISIIQRSDSEYCTARGHSKRGGSYA